MTSSPPALARAQKGLPKKLQEGTIVSFTRVLRPPAEFGPHPRTIGMILLKDGTHVLGQLSGEGIAIGKRVVPRMRLNRITAEGLRIYDIAYEDIQYSKNIREQIDAFLKESNFASLLDKLRKRRDELGEKTATAKKQTEGEENGG